MRRLDLINALSSRSGEEEDVFIEIDGVLYEIEDELRHKEATFDGFYTAYPAATVLKVSMKD